MILSVHQVMDFFYMIVGEAYRNEDIPIPFVPYPINPNTGGPVKTKLKPTERRSDLK